MFILIPIFIATHGPVFVPGWVGRGISIAYWGDWSDRAELQTHSTLLSSAVEDSNKDEATRARSDKAHNVTLAKCNARATLEWILSRVGQGKTGYPCLSYHKDL